MLQITDNITGIKKTTVSRQPRRRRRGRGYRLSLEHRAAVAARMVKEHGWSARRAAGLFCVNPTYVGLARQLSDHDRFRLAHDELKLAGLWRDYRRRLAERAPACEITDSELEKIITVAGPDRVLRFLDKLTAPLVAAE